MTNLPTLTKLGELDIIMSWVRKNPNKVHLFNISYSRRVNSSQINKYEGTLWLKYKTIWEEYQITRLEIIINDTPYVLSKTETMKIIGGFSNQTDTIKFISNILNK